MRPWQYAEERAAKVLGGRRVKRDRYESARDVEGVPGFVVEVKHRASLPRLIVNAIEQACRYRVLEEKPLVVLFERGSREGLAVLRLADFADLIRDRERRPA